MVCDMSNFLLNEYEWMNVQSTEHKQMEKRKKPNITYKNTPKRLIQTGINDF